MSKLQKSALNAAKRASEQILLTESPDIPEKAILYALAKNGPMSLTDIVKSTSNYGEWEANHYTVKRRIKGLSNHIGLVDYEFVKERDPEVRKQGKYGKIYHLTTKGFLAALSTGLSFERIDIFKKYTVFLSEKLNRKITYVGKYAGFDSSLDEKTREIMLDVIIKYIKYQILVFLIWNEANETSIRKKINLSWHIEDFFKKHDEHINEEFPMKLEEKFEKEYKSILREYFIYYKSFHGLDEFVLPGDTFSKKINDNFKMISPFVFKWYLYFDKLQMMNPIGKSYDVNRIQSIVLSKPRFGINIEHQGVSGEESIQKRIESQLSEILKIDIHNEIMKEYQGSTIHRHKN